MIRWCMRINLRNGVSLKEDMVEGADTSAAQRRFIVSNNEAE